MEKEKVEQIVEPGAARFGNFPDYYKFNRASERMKHVLQLRRDHFSDISCGSVVQCVDVGCNTGVRKQELKLINNLGSSNTNFNF